MGQLIDGQWQNKRLVESSDDGSFERAESSFRNWISTDYPAEVGRYHLYVSHACPWAHRTMVVRTLKQLEPVVSVSVVDPVMLDDGWQFSEENPDHLYGFQYLREVYLRSEPMATTRVTVPVLWDKESETIVNNESSEILRMLNREFDYLGGDSTLDLTPGDRLEEIDAINQRVYDNVNNGVYRCGFATTQEAYEQAFESLFETLDFLERRLAGQRYLVGPSRTEADWRLFTTLVRFDAVYHYHFKCNLRRIRDYPNLSNYLKELYQVPGVADTVHFDHIKQHYFKSHRSLNPNQIVPVGPEIELEMAHDRAKLAH